MQLLRRHGAYGRYLRRKENGGAAGGHRGRPAAGPRPRLPLRRRLNSPPPKPPSPRTPAMRSTGQAVASTIREMPTSRRAVLSSARTAAGTSRDPGV